jgi:hypothetical protein
MIMKKLRTAVFLAVMFILTVMQKPATAQVITLGNQDFADGSFPGGTSGFEGPSADDPPPFNVFHGSDSDTPFATNWFFNYGIPGNISSASITIGIHDHDSKASGSQVSSFTIDDNDLTDLLDAAFESHGGAQDEDNVYTIPIPVSALPSLIDGSAAVRLVLKGPGLGNRGETFGNGAGLDFSTLSIQDPPSPPPTSAPEPGSLASLLGGGVAGSLIVLRRRTNSHPAICCAERWIR